MNINRIFIQRKQEISNILTMKISKLFTFLQINSAWGDLLSYNRYQNNIYQKLNAENSVGGNYMPQIFVYLLKKNPALAKQLLEQVSKKATSRSRQNYGGYKLNSFQKHWLK